MDPRPPLPDRPDETLDPADDGEWRRLRALAHRMLDDALDFHQGVASRPVWRPMPQASKDAIAGAASARGDDLEVVYDEFREHIEPFPYGNVHPRNWGWVNGQGSALGSLAELWAATMNPNCWGAEHSATYVEAQVLAWLKNALGYPAGGEGLLVSGGSMANLIGLTAAREAASPGTARAGLTGLGRPLAVYASTEVHGSVDKAVALLGLGTDQLRRIPVDSSWRIDVAALAERIASDRRAGVEPLAVVASAGTVATGALDELDRIADVCRDERLWLHVDGAFGALAALSPALRPLLRGLERADSIAFDLHKWMYVPIEAGCVLVRDGDLLRAVFAPPASYLEQFARGIPSGPHRYSNLGPQLTRSFRALKVWFYIRAFGFEKIGRLVEQNVRQARLLERLVVEHPDLELIAPATLNVVAFRWRGSLSDEARIEAVNRELLMRLWESGIAAVSSARIGGRFALRAAFTNHRTRGEDVRLASAAIAALGETVANGG
jgi:glutamate/tyrosine decarboxylase-like PLP-dependent enzyme